MKIKGYKSKALALKRAKQVSSNPELIRIGEEYFPLSLQLMSSNGTLFRVIYGQKGTMLSSELEVNSFEILRGNK